MAQKRMLIAGIGNIFMGDDAFGCEVIKQLAGRHWSDSITVTDFGIRGLDLSYALMRDYDTSILIDATPQGGAPGTVYVMELTLSEAGEPAAIVDAHTMHPLNVLRMVETLGGNPRRILLVGCEPADLGDELEGKMGLSEPVQAAIPTAVTKVKMLVDDFLAENHDEQSIAV